MTSNPFRWSFRAQCLSGFAICAALIGFAIYSQLQWGLEPCPLCIFQRIAFAALGLVFLVAGLHAPRGATGRGIYGGLGFLAAAVGLRLPHHGRSPTVGVGISADNRLADRSGGHRLQGDGHDQRSDIG